MHYDLLSAQLRRCAEGRCIGCPRIHAEGCRSSVSTEAADAIEELSKERKNGKWFIDGNGTLRCSECKEEALLTLDAIEDVPFSTFSESHFCPNCGSKMEG